VTSCGFNRPGVGVVCGWLTGPSGQCHHPQHGEVWRLLTEEAQALAAEAAPILEPAPVIPALSGYEPKPIGPVRSLASRVTAASKPMSPERARQLALAFADENTAPGDEAGSGSISRGTAKVGHTWGV